MVDSNEDAILFVCPSWSRPDLHHDVYVDRRTGEITCSCEDASCRKKKPHLLDLLAGECDACKHQRSVVVAYRRLLDAEG